MKKVAIIGGGASGLCCAIMLKRLNIDIDVTIFESNDRVGKKLAITGNGRCNISNEQLSADRYHGDAKFAKKIIDNFDFQNQKKFFDSIGLPFIIEENGKAFPMSLQAGSVVDILRFECSELKINILLSSKVEKVIKNNNAFTVFSNNKSYDFDAVITATGGKAGGKIADDSGYKILKSLGHKIEPLFPAIVQMKTETDIIRSLKGVKVVGKITLFSGDFHKTDMGEILFCDYGISGPPVLQLSRYSNENKCCVEIDFMPDFSHDELVNIINKRIEHQKNRLTSELFTGFINKRLGQVVLKMSECNLNDVCKTISCKQIDNLATLLKCFRLTVIGNTGFSNAQVTAGGAQTNQFFDNLMSKKVKGLFAIGEILNVDGDCGGFNLAFAWASANAAANGVIEYLNYKD